LVYKLYGNPEAQILYSKFVLAQQGLLMRFTHILLTACLLALVVLQAVAAHESSIAHVEVTQAPGALPGWSFSGFLTGLVSWLFPQQEPAPQQTHGLNLTFIAPQEAPYAEARASYDTSCAPKNESCIRNAMIALTARYGPTHALHALADLKREGLVSPEVDDHQLAHQIGRTTAQSFGVSPQAFFLCVSEFNNGCEHGYFEYVMKRVPSAKDAVVVLCDTLNDSFSHKFKFSCYHGAGHGIMMLYAYDLNESLAVCDQLNSHEGREGCWQGVFMENVNSAIVGIMREGVFSEENPLAPCDTMPKQYQHECFINHAGWLMKIYHHNVYNTTRACLKAPADRIGACMQSVGLMITNPVWQAQLAQKKINGTFAEVAWKLCTLYPEGYVGECVVGSIDNLLNFDVLNLNRSLNLCAAARPEFGRRCYYQIGINIRRNGVSPEELAQKCAELPQEFVNDCRQGAGLQ
jgi:hypothetical protein